MNTTLTTALNELALGSAKSAELPLNDLPADVQGSMLADSPLCETVRLTVFTRKGERFYMATAQKGSRDGFPIITRRF